MSYDYVVIYLPYCCKQDLNIINLNFIIISSPRRRCCLALFQLGFLLGEEVLVHRCCAFAFAIGFAYSSLFLHGVYREHCQPKSLLSVRCFIDVSAIDRLVQ